MLLWWGTTITALQAERCRCFPGRSSYLQNLDRFLQQTPSLPQHDSITHAEFILPCKIFTLFPRKSLLFHSNSTLCTEKEAGGEQWGSGPYAPAFIALSSPPCSIQGILQLYLQLYRHWPRSQDCHRSPKHGDPYPEESFGHGVSTALLVPSNAGWGRQLLEGQCTLSLLSAAWALLHPWVNCPGKDKLRTLPWKTFLSSFFHLNRIPKVLHKFDNSDLRVNSKPTRRQMEEAWSG